MLNRKMIGIILFFFSGCNQLWGMKKDIFVGEDQVPYCSVLSLTASVKKVGNSPMRRLIFPVPAERRTMQTVNIQAKCPLSDKKIIFNSTGVAFIKAQLNSDNINDDFIFSLREYRDVKYYYIKRTEFDESLKQNGL